MTDTPKDMPETPTDRAGLIHSLEAILSAARAYAEYTVQDADAAARLHADCDLIEDAYGRTSADV